MKRIYYIDNLRIFLIALVVLHHLAITYGGPGGWYYVENESDSISSIPLTMSTWSEWETANPDGVVLGLPGPIKCTLASNPLFTRFSAASSRCSGSTAFFL